MTSRNVQRGGRYRFSEEVDSLIRHARESLAAFLNAYEPEEVAQAVGYVLGQWEQEGKPPKE